MASPSSFSPTPLSEHPISSFANPRNPDRLIRLGIGPASQTEGRPWKLDAFPEPAARRRTEDAEKPSLELEDYAEERWRKLLDTLAVFGVKDREVIAVTGAITPDAIHLWISLNTGQRVSKLVEFYEDLWMDLCRWRRVVKKAQDESSLSEGVTTPDLNPHVSQRQFETFARIMKHGWRKWKGVIMKGGEPFQRFFDHFLLIPDDGSALRASMIKFGEYLQRAITIFREASAWEDLDVETGIPAELYFAMLTLWKEGRELVKNSLVLAQWSRDIILPSGENIDLHRLIKKKTYFGQNFSVFSTLSRSNRMNIFLQSSTDPTMLQARDIVVKRINPLQPVQRSFTQDDIQSTLNAFAKKGHEARKAEIAIRAKSWTRWNKSARKWETEEQLTYSPKVHAELLQISYHIDPAKQAAPRPFGYIGISKLGCYSCTKWVEVYNNLAREQQPSSLLSFGIRDCSFKPYPDWGSPLLPSGLEQFSLDLQNELSKKFIHDYNQSPSGHTAALSDVSVQSGTSDIIFNEVEETLDGGLDEELSLFSQRMIERRRKRGAEEEKEKERE